MQITIWSLWQLSIISRCLRIIWSGTSVYNSSWHEWANGTDTIPNLEATHHVPNTDAWGFEGDWIDVGILNITFSETNLCSFNPQLYDKSKDWHNIASLFDSGTLQAAVTLLKQAKADILECLVLLELSDLQGKARIDSPVFSLIQVTGDWVLYPIVFFRY